MKYKRIVESVYSGIREKYEFIHQIAIHYNREDSCFDFDSQLKESEEYAKNSPKFTYMTIKLNQLAGIWDTVLAKSRKQNKGTEDIVKPSHKFIFIPSTHKRRNKPEASLYCKNLPPDNRLISIRIAASKNRSLLCILHEMGHFIGWRKRNDRLNQYMISMMAEAICLQVYEYACRELTGITSDDQTRIGCIYHVEQHYTSDIRNDSSEIIIALRKSLKDVEHGLQKRFNQFKAIYIDESRRGDGIEIDEAKGVEGAFFSSIQAIMLEAIYDMTADESFIEHIAEAIPNKERKKNEKLKSCLRSAFTKLRADVTMKKPLWFDEFEKRLEEPAADIFMIKMSGISIKQYIKLITIQLQELFAEIDYSEDQLYATLALPVNTVRFISVCMACNANEKDFRCSTDWFFKLLPFHTKALERIRLRKQLYEMYKSGVELRKSPDDLDFFDPTHHVVEYVSKLYDDDRYNEAKGEYKEYIQKMKRIVRQSISIWNSPFGDAIALLKLKCSKL